MSTTSCRRLPLRMAVSCLGALALATVGQRQPEARRLQAEGSRPHPAQAPTDTRHYSIAARVRPVLFWVGKDSVGEARLTWLAGPNGERGYELLIGSDPARAPRKINQWGYVREMEEEGRVRVIGLMTDRDEEEKAGYGDARPASDTTHGPQLFKAIQAAIGGGHAMADVQRLTLPEALTFRDLDAVLARVAAPDYGDPIALPAGTHPGFLFAMTSLLHESVETCLRTGVPPIGGLRRSYFFGKKVYIITTLTSKLQDQTTIKGRDYRRVINSEFEARLADQPKGETFRVAYGTEGALREVPIRIVYRPNFWFEAELALVERAPAGR